MIKIIWNKSTVYFALLALIQPFWAAVAFMLMSAKNRPTKTQVVLLIAICSLLGIYWYPWGDAQIHFGTYYCDTVSRYSDGIIIKVFKTYDIVIKSVADLLGNYMWGYYIWIFVPWAVYGMLIWNKVQQDNIVPYTLVLLVLILLIGIRELLDLNRNSAAFLLFVSAVIVYNRHRFVAIILYLISFVLHSSCIGLFVFAILCHLFLCNVRRRFLVMLFMVAFACNWVISYILGLFVSDKFAEVYLTGSFGVGTGVQSGFFYLMTMVNIGMTIMLGIFILKNITSIRRTFLCSCYIASSILVLSTWMLWTMRERFLIANLLLGFTVLIGNWKFLNMQQKSNFVKVLRLLVLFAVVKISLVFGVEYSSEIIHRTGSKDPEKTFSTVVNPIYLPTIMIVDIDSYGFNDMRLSSEFPIAKHFISTQ